VKARRKTTALTIAANKFRGGPAELVTGQQGSGISPVFRQGVAPEESWLNSLHVSVHESAIGAS
jgi:hypothetical protein